MARIKYYYDTETCRYERIRVKRTDIFLNLLGFFLLSAIVGGAGLAVLSVYYESPKEAILRKENEELKMYYDILEQEMQTVDKMLLTLQERDDNVYRTIFEADPIPGDIRDAGFGGAERYRMILESDVEQKALVLESLQRLDKLKKKMYIQTKSYDELLTLARNKNDMLASIPAIQPVHNKELRRVASGFGYRFHPILKVRRMHAGIDFSAPRGTPIYATGDGRVRRVQSSLGGYGKQVEIDHGYGFVTKYAHMSAFNVRQGQEVKRGECIGYVGNTGLSVAPHLHYEVIKDGRKIDPVHYFYNDLDAEEYEVILKLASIENQSLGM